MWRTLVGFSWSRHTELDDNLILLVVELSHLQTRFGKGVSVDGTLFLIVTVNWVSR